MFSKLRTKFGIPGVVAVVALVFALTGGAFATAGGGATASKAKVKKVKGPRGPAGPQGSPGPQGPPGANGKDGAPGAAGEKGKDGTNGTNGTNGTSGADGKSVEAEPANVGECEEGGTRFKIGGVTKGKACNGEEGPPGPAGNPWTAGGVLPPSATETGTWSVAGKGATPVGPAIAVANLSFPIPLPAALEAEDVHIFGATFEGEGEQEEQEREAEELLQAPLCDNGQGEPASVQHPEADPGQLCIFVGSLFGAGQAPTAQGVSLGEPGAATSGASLLFVNPGASGVLGTGSFAVTAPAGP